MDKTYARINWLNEPSTNTPLNQSNLNKMDYALNEIDNRVVSFDSTKANQSDLLLSLKDFDITDDTGVITITYQNGTTKTFDTNLEKIAVNYRYDKNKQILYIVMPDKTEQPVDLSSLISQYEFLDSNTIGFSVDENGKVKANVIKGSITDDMIQPNYLSDLKAESALAKKSSESSSQSASESDYNAKVSQSYAIGQSGIRENEDYDNSRYYMEQCRNIAETVNVDKIPVDYIDSLFTDTEG
ncbi:MAG: hypothetical protein KBT03_07965 [Bacteroidales bacterium]|nr:hypothetical protein [Candidatus Scybalousia scybalohippi]